MGVNWESEISTEVSTGTFRAHNSECMWTIQLFTLLDLLWIEYLVNHQLFVSVLKHGVAMRMVRMNMYPHHFQYLFRKRFQWDILMPLINVLWLDNLVSAYRLLLLEYVLKLLSMDGTTSHSEFGMVFFFFEGVSNRNHVSKTYSCTVLDWKTNNIWFINCDFDLPFLFE